MSDPDIQVIVERVDNFMAYIKAEIAEIKTRLYSKCDNCVNIVELRTKNEFQWWVIGIFAAIFTGTIGTVIWKLITR